MPKLFPEKLNPAHDAAVRRMLAASLNGREATDKRPATVQPPFKPSKPLFRHPPAAPRR